MFSWPIMLRFIMFDDMSLPIMLEFMFCPIVLRPIMFFSIICCPIMLCMLSWSIMLRFITLEDMSRPITLEYMFCPIMLRPIMFSSILLRPILFSSIMLRAIIFSFIILLSFMFLSMLEDLSIKPYMLRWEDIWFILFPCITFLDISRPIKLYTRGPSRGGLELLRELSLRVVPMNEVILVWRRSGSTDRSILF